MFNFQDAFTDLYKKCFVFTLTLCMPWEQWIAGFTWHQKIKVTQYQPHLRKLDILDFTRSHKCLINDEIFKIFWDLCMCGSCMSLFPLVWAVHEGNQFRGWPCHCSPDSYNRKWLLFIVTYIGVHLFKVLYRT